MCQLWSGTNLCSVSFSSANSKSHLNIKDTEVTLYSEDMKTGLTTLLCLFCLIIRLAIGLGCKSVKALHNLRCQYNARSQVNFSPTVKRKKTASLSFKEG